MELHNIKFYEHRVIVPESFQARRRTDDGLSACNWCSAEMPACVASVADDDAVHMGRPITTTATSVTAATHIALLLLLVPFLLR